MRILQIYNQYRSLFNGEEAVVMRTAELLTKYRHETRLLIRSSRGIETRFVRKAQAAVSGVYSWSGYREVARALRAWRPDIVHAHNLYPLWSPSVLRACRAAGVPVVMSIHNQQLTCPKADHLRCGKVCEECVGGREYRCVVNNCRGSWMESAAYALRSALASRAKLFHKNVDILIALSEAAKQRLVAAGFAREQIAVLPNMADIAPTRVDPANNAYFAFAGRVSAEKGIETLLAAARKMPQLEVRLAGDGPLLAKLRAQSPANVRWLGRLDAAAMRALYRNARCVIHPSTCFEMCPLVISEAMAHGVPVIASRIGGREELVDDGVTGLLFKPSDAAELAVRMRQIAAGGALCQRLGWAGHAKAIRQHSEPVYYARLRTIYLRAMGVASAEAAPPEANRLAGKDVTGPCIVPLEAAVEKTVDCGNASGGFGRCTGPSGECSA